MACITFPIKTILNESGTYTSNQNFTDLDASDVHAILFGMDVTAIDAGDVTMTVYALMPDGNNYEISTILTGGVGQAKIPSAITGLIPAQLSVSLGLVNGATSVTTSVWIIGQA